MFRAGEFRSHRIDACLGYIGVTADLLRGILADEIQHVRYANEWFKRMPKEDPTVLLKLAAGVNFVRTVMKALTPAPGETNAVGVDLNGFEHVEVMANIDDRRLAGFTEREIDEILRQEAALRVSVAATRSGSVAAH